MNYWLMKTEPDAFSIDDLQRVKKEAWNGVRNYQARNFMRDQMKKGDLVLIYHSSCKTVGVAGIGIVASESYPDETQFKKSSKYYDEKATQSEPRWYLVDIAFKEKLSRIITLKEIKESKKLIELQLIKKGNRLSIMPLKEDEFKTILSLE